MKKLIVFLSFILILCMSSLVVLASDLYVIDDRSDTMHYTSSSRVYLDGANNASVSSVASGNSVTFQMWGSELYIYCSQYTNSGYVAVYIDNVYKGKYDSGRSSDYTYKHLLCSFTDLTAKEHEVVLVCTSDYVKNPSGSSVAGRFYFDYIEVSEIYKDYYTDTVLIFLAFIAVLLGFFCILKIVEFWRYLKNDH